MSVNNKYADVSALKRLITRVKSWANSRFALGSTVDAIKSDIAVGGVNLLDNTNRKTKGWIANGSSDGRFSMTSTRDGNVVFINNATSANPQWQTAMFEMDASRIKAGHKYTLSFLAGVIRQSGANYPVNVAVRLQTDDGKSAITTRMETVTIPVENTVNTPVKLKILFTGQNPTPTPASGKKFYVAFNIKVNTTSVGAKWTRFEILDLMLEEGNTATAWRLSNNDISTRLQAIETKLGLG